MFSTNRCERQKKVADSDKIKRAVILKIEETLYHLACLDIIARDLFRVELDTQSISDMKDKMLTLLRQARSN